MGSCSCNQSSKCMGIVKSVINNLRMTFKDMIYRPRTAPKLKFSLIAGDTLQGDVGYGEAVIFALTIDLGH